MTAWLVIIGAALGTYACRASMLVLLADRQPPPRLMARMAVVGPAATAALVAASLMSGEGDGVELSEVLAAVAGFLAVRRTGQVAAALLVGMPVLWAARAVGLR